VGVPLQGRGDRDINPFKIPYAQTRSPFRTMADRVQNLHIGLVSAGLGGLTAAVTIARAGAKVTVLEAVAELGEIGAGVQMRPNISRFLIKWGVSGIIGDDLVQCDNVNMRQTDGKVIAYTDLKKTVKDYGYPWYGEHLVWNQTVANGLSVGGWFIATISTLV
jgi:hypothetical protein